MGCIQTPENLQTQEVQTKDLNNNDRYQQDNSNHKARGGANIIADDLIIAVHEDHFEKIDETATNKLEKLIEGKGFFSNIDTMNAKTSEIILQIEEKENLCYKDYLQSYNRTHSTSEDLIDKGVIQFNDGSFYSGTWNSNFKKHGVGSLLMTNGSKYVGEFNNDNIEGKGYYVDSTGRLYIGEFKNGKANGIGKITCEKDPGYSYEGGFKDNLFHGQGTERLQNGNIYIGEFVQGVKEPKGKLIFSEGATYVGDFKKSIIEGKGIFKWKDGRVYEGDFVDNKLNGNGKTTWVDGSYYEGEYKNDQFNGYGVLVSSDGSIFKGNWLNNYIHGVGYYKDLEQEYRGLWRYNKNIKKY